jgi:uncharacterized protein (TIGR02996 family)
MATLEAQLAAVLAAPDDEDARLAYSDAVAATDVARAELIKLQIVLSRWRRNRENPPTRPQASARQAELLDKHAARWAASIAPHVKGWSFLRGFVEVVRLDAARFLETAPLLYRTAPILHLDLEAVKPVAAELFASPHLARIQSLELRQNELGDAEAKLLAASPHLDALKWLGLSNNAIGEAGLEALAATKNLPALGYLDFRWNGAGDPTPQDADEYSADSPAATALQAKFGKRPWLTAKPRFAWPPERDAVVE